MLQRDLFETDAVVMLQEEIGKLKMSNDNVRKSLFARYNQLERMVLEMEEVIFRMKQKEMQT